MLPTLHQLTSDSQASIRSFDGFASQLDSSPRIFVDMSFTYHSHLQTGVHRVVRQIAHHLPSIYEGQVTTLVVEGGKLVTTDCMSSRWLSSKLKTWRSDLIAHLPKRWVNLQRIICQWLPKSRLRRWLLPEPGHRGLYRYPLWFLQRIAAISEPPLLHQEFRRGDLLILPDAYWACDSIWPSIERAKAQGAWICTLVYDLIPLDYPEFVAEGASKAFQSYLNHVLQYSDHIITISETVRQQIIAKAASSPGHQDPFISTDSFELGVDRIPASSTPIRNSIQQVMKKEDGLQAYLMVATFEPRKNHEYVLDAFDALWKTNPNQNLCLVGRAGWKCERTMQRIKNHPKLGKQLHVFHDLDDAEVDYCFRNAKALLFPSIVEGFGLPIIEAISHGCHVFASDTAIHREVGREVVTYFDLKNPIDLATSIERWEQTPSTEIQPVSSPRVPLTWRESTRALLCCCLEEWCRNHSSEIASSNEPCLT